MYISFDFKPSPAGGGYQFLSALREEMRHQHLYAEEPTQASSFLFNANPHSLSRIFQQATQFKKIFPQTPLVLRVDGPLALIRGGTAYEDTLFKKLATLLFDGIVYQSRWSQENNQRLYQTKAPFEIVIYNAANTATFHRSDRHLMGTTVTKLIATSWSTNQRKGFDVYDYLDKNLDFKRYQMTFVGNTPKRFKYIRHVPPLPSSNLAELLQEHDIYITASRNDPCSNALLEALASGLPAVVLQSGGHPELLQLGGELFRHQNELLEKIEMVRNNYEAYQNRLPRYSLAKVAAQYFAFAQRVVQAIRSKQYQPKKLTVASAASLRLTEVHYALKSRFFA